MWLSTSQVVIRRGWCSLAGVFSGQVQRWSYRGNGPGRSFVEFPGEDFNGGIERTDSWSVTNLTIRVCWGSSRGFDSSSQSSIHQRQQSLSVCSGEVAPYGDGVDGYRTIYVLIVSLSSRRVIEFRSRFDLSFITIARD